MLPLNWMIENRLYTGKIYTVVPFHVMKAYKGKYRYSCTHSSHSQLNSPPSLPPSKQYQLALNRWDSEPVWSHFGKKKIPYSCWDSKLVTSSCTEHAILVSCWQTATFLHIGKSETLRGFMELPSAWNTRLFLFCYSYKALISGLFDELFGLWRLFTVQWQRNSMEFNNCPTRCDLFRLLYFCRQLYTFRVLTPIIRSSYNCNYSIWYWLTGSTTIRSRCWVPTVITASGTD